mmetsp:Transcript_13869/g.44387  ORF Transcript_13869/g.44387 Transcript_13869/m.44387 type:complete len:755 (+) Transcript_13869:64-2328(+)
MGSGLSRARSKNEVSAVNDHKPDKFWVEDKTFDAENSLVYANSPLFNELRSILSEPLGQKFLGEFAKSENSQENLFAWIDMEEYKQIPTHDFRLCVARNIFKKYIKEKAVMQLGGLSKERIDHYYELIYPNAVVKTIEGPDTTPVLLREDTKQIGRVVLKPELFLGLQHMVFRELAENTFRRFKESPKYEEYLSQRNATYNVVDVDDFEYLSFLGQGAFGAVVHVRKKSTGKEYALKVMSKSKLIKTLGRRGSRQRRREKLMMERNVYVNSQFPFITAMHYALQTPQDAIIVMEFCRGGTLEGLMQQYQDKRMPEEHVKFVAAELMLALRHMHQSNYLHRDLKPINILLDSKGHVKLADMGLVARIDDTKGVVKRLRSEAVLEHHHHNNGDSDEDEDEDEDDESDADTARGLANETIEETSPAAEDSEKSSTSEKDGKSPADGASEDQDVGGKPSASPDKASEAGTSQASPTSPAGDKSPKSVSTGRRLQSPSHAENAGQPLNVRPMEFVGRRYTRVGTMGYKAPELLGAKRPKASGSENDRTMGYGCSVDWWAFGVLIFEMYTGKNVFAPRPTVLLGSQNPEKIELDAATAVKKPSELLPRAADLSPAGKDFLDQLLVVDPSMRLGCNLQGWAGLRNHDWFADLNLSNLLNQEIRPPYKEQMRMILDSAGLSAKPRWASFDQMKIEVSSVDLNALMGETTVEDIKEEEQEYFAGWDYVAPSAFKQELSKQQERTSVAVPEAELPAALRQPSQS